MQRLVRHSNSTKFDMNLLTLGQLSRISTGASTNEVANPSGWLLLYLAVLTGKKPSKLSKITLSQTTRLLASLRKRASRARRAEHQAGQNQLAQ
jgi:hypothetical protein